jgi:hypothetical protein
LKTLEYPNTFSYSAPFLNTVGVDINAIEVHALDHCPDRGIKNFKRYVSLAIVAHNIHKIGALVQEKERRKNKRQRSNIPIAA